MEFFKQFWGEANVVITAIGAVVTGVTGFITLYLKWKEMQKVRRQETEPTTAANTAPVSPPPTAPPVVAPPSASVAEPMVELQPEIIDAPRARPLYSPPPPAAVPVVRPSQRVRTASSRRAPAPDWISNDVRNKVHPAGMALATVGVLTAVWNIICVFVGLVQMADPRALAQGPNRGPNPWVVDEVRPNPDGGFQMPPPQQPETVIPPLTIVLFLCMALGAAGSAMAGFGMMSLRGYSLSILGSLAIIPCTFSCCFLGAPVGIWCLILLMSDDVKSAFET
jgi:hypothetical protein